MEDTKSNVISLFDKKKEVTAKETNDEATFSFEEITEMNKKLKAKREKERNGENKAVLRSYRIKN